MLEKPPDNPRRLLIVFVKEPLPGKVKTRLAATVGEDEAVRRYQALVAILLKQLRGLNDCRVRICYAPDEADEAIRFWILPQLNGIAPAPAGSFLWADGEGGVDFCPQGEGDLGDRLERAYAQGFAEGYEKVAAIGSDCISMGAGWINAAFTQLRADRPLVVGPTPDGGYYFLALNESRPELFREIPWSGEETLQETLQVAENLGLSHRLLPPLNDIDDEADWDEMIEGPQGAAMKKLMESI